ncbi:hypothetical protein QP902_05600 [Corynebacterium marquesiae]|nr:hypothetical protein [Corynebacterium marquesiae]MDK8668158.1 hypothetical protein [Corynebacterium marquesiae]
MARSSWASRSRAPASPGVQCAASEAAHSGSVGSGQEHAMLADAPISGTPSGSSPATWEDAALEKGVKT